MASTVKLVGINPLANKAVLGGDVLWTRLVGKVLRDFKFQHLFGHELPEKQREFAERIMDQAIGFLRVVATGGRSVSYSPSDLVDIGWHVFLLYTREYAAFCQKIAGHFIHHCPSDVPGEKYETGSIARTVAAMSVRNMFVDEALWPEATYSSCGNTGEGGDGCGGMGSCDSN